MNKSSTWNWINDAKSVKAQVLYSDPRTGDCTRLIELLPDSTLSESESGSIQLYREYVVISGCMRNIRTEQVSYCGDHAFYSPGKPIDDQITSEGCLILEIVRPGKHVNHWLSKFADNQLLRIERRLGIGSGTSANNSGEAVVFNLLAALDLNQITVVDVGANKGLYSELALRHLDQHSDLTIHCFEPSVNTFALLQKRLANESRCRLNNCGLSNQITDAVLYTDREFSGLASLTKRNLDHFNIEHGKFQETVNLTTLDQYCKENQIENIDLLKIDVEGHELDVLVGASNLLNRNSIKLVQFEFGGCNIDTRTYFKDFFDLFTLNRFELFRILPNAKLMHLPEYREIDEKFRTTNFLAIHSNIQWQNAFGAYVE